MKKILIALAFTHFCVLQIFAQESSVKILLNDEERFRFEDQRLEFVNPGHHVLIGDSAGYHLDNSSGYNVFLGYQAGFKTTTGWDNVFIGDSAGYNNLGGSWNTAVGSWAGYANTSGSENSFFGLVSGGFNTTGSKNSYFGFQSGVFNESGSLNSYFGYFSGYRNNGIKNVFLGAYAGKENLGDSNVFIGYNADMQGSNLLVIDNVPRPNPLIYGEFDNQILRFNANRIETGFNENIFIGDSTGARLEWGGANVFLGFRAGMMHEGGSGNIFIGDSAGFSNKSGETNTYIGSWAGIYDQAGRANVFVGCVAGIYNTSGQRNVFVGHGSGYYNSTGTDNAFFGTSSGVSNTTGNNNTYIGRRAGENNQTGSGNVSLGYYAGAQEHESDKLYIANSGTTEPLIYGDFAAKKLKFHADSVQTTGVVHSSGEVRTDQQFNASGNPGITDTINSITDIDFSQQKFKYLTTVYSGGIATFISLESEWVDTIIEYLVPCGEIGLVGEFNNWTDDAFLARNDYNPDLWTLSVKFTIADDQSEPVDSIVEVKFREDGGWDVNWGSAEFPAGTGYQGGENIPVTLSDSEDTTLYFINFNCRTGVYSFTDLTGYCSDSVTDPRDGKKYATVLIGNQCWMAQDLNIGTRINGSSDQTNNQTIEKYCYDNLESNCSIWGGLYQRPELMQYIVTPGTKGICMDGWHVPTDEEFKIQEGNVDSQFGLGAAEWNKTGWRGYDAGLNLRAATGWSGSENGTDAFGFHAVPGGYLIDYNLFTDGGACLNYQTSSSDSFGAPVIRHINGDFNQITRNTNPADDGCSLRCLKD